MKTVVIILAVTSLFCACHDTSVHNIHAPAIDTTGNAALNKPKDTSVHTGTIPGVVEKMTADLKLVPAVIGPGEAFSQLMIIHRTAVYQLCQIEISEGGKAEVFDVVRGVQRRTYQLLKGFESFLRDNLPGRKTNTLRYKIPITKETVERMVHQESNTDKQFVEMLIAIEKSEIALAQSYLKEGKNKKLRSLANEIIVANRKEIAQLSLQKN